MAGTWGPGPARSIAELLAEVPVAPGKALTRADKAVLWSASQRLDGSASTQGAEPPVLPMPEEEWQIDSAHNFLLQFVSFAAQPGQLAPRSAFFSFRFYHFETRTTPRAFLSASEKAAASAAAPAAAASAEAQELGEALRAETLRADGEAGATTPSATAGAASDLVLVAADEQFAREGPGLVERFLLQPPAEGTEGHADWDSQASAQLRRLRSYLRDKSVYVDMWDGDSLLQIGTARVPLLGMLRQGMEKMGHASTVKEYMTVDLLGTRLTSIDAAPSMAAETEAPTQLRGQLKLVLARLSSGGLRVQGQPLAPPESKGVQLTPTQCHKVRLRSLPMGTENVDHSRAPTAAEESALFQRQLRRHKQREWLRANSQALTSGALSRSQGANVARANEAAGVGSAWAALGSAPGSVARSLELGLDKQHSLARARLQLSMRSLRAAEEYRRSHRQNRIRGLLAESVQLVRYIYPFYGSCELIELPFRNPYGTEHCFTISWDDPEGQLSIVSSLDEWRALKLRDGLNTPGEDQMVLHGQQLWLMPQELVYIPLKFQSWQWGQVPLEPPAAALGAVTGVSADATATAGGSGEAAGQPISQRSLAVRVLNVQQEQVATLEVRVRPQPYIIGQSFRFHQSEHEFLKTTISLAKKDDVRWVASGQVAPSPQLEEAPRPLAPSRNPPPPPLPLNSTAPQPLWLRCSEPDVVASARERDGAGPIEVSLKYAVGASPGVKRFLLLLYVDPWMHQLHETWEVVVHSLKRLDVSALVGQSCAVSLPLSRQPASAGLVQCYSSADEMRVTPSAPFSAASADVTELGLSLRPAASGRKQYLVNMVAQPHRKLLCSWLVCAVNRLPAITKVAPPSRLCPSRPSHAHLSHDCSWLSKCRSLSKCRLLSKCRSLCAGLQPLRALATRRQQEGLPRQPVLIRRALPLKHRQAAAAQA